MMDYSIKDPQDNSIPVRNIYCVGRNYRAHAKELNNLVPDEPFFFQKSTPALNTGSIIKLPKNRIIQYELEIVVLVGTMTESVNPGEELNLVSGLALGLDLTDRNFQTTLKEKRLPWLFSKSFSGAAVVTKFIDPHSSLWNQDFWFKINGQIVQRGNRNQMLYSIPELLRYLLQHIPVLKGDLIFTGTPEGVGNLAKGDRCKIGIGEKTLAVYKVQ
ncbi:MAG: fumarylacetoacetate hydrolase family protein [Fidelibacterota bacterium]